MTIREVKFTTTTELGLQCESCVPASVIIAVPPSLVLNSYGDLPGFIEAQLTEVIMTGVFSRTYTLTYDDPLLQDVDVAVLPSDILGIFCKGFREQWVIDIARRTVPI